MVRDLQGLPPYRRIAAQIIETIKSGELQPGDHVPSVQQIMDSEGVSRATAARVPAVLREAGFADAVSGVGTIVRAPKQLTPGAFRLQLVRDGGTGMAGDDVEFLGADRQPATQEVADALGLEHGDEVAWRRRRYFDTGGVTTVSTTWVAGIIADQAPAFLTPEKLPTMTFGLIEEHTGRRAVKRRDTVSLREVPDDTAEQLGVSPGAPVLTMVNRYWDQHGEPTEFAIDYIAPGRELSAEYDIS